ALPQIRQLIAAGRYPEAEALASARIMAKPLRQMPYGTLGDLLLNFADAGAPLAYERALDLETAVATTRWRTPAGSFRREAFVSAPDQVVVLRMTAARGRMRFDIAWRGPQAGEFIAPGYRGPATEPKIAPTPSDWQLSEAAGALPAGAVVAADGEGAWLVTGRNETYQDIAGGLTYAMRIRVVTDGVVGMADGRLAVHGARTATLVIAAATSYVNYHDISGDPVATVRRQSEAAAAKAYETLRQDHIRDYRALYGLVSLDLGRTAASANPTDVRIAAEGADDPALSALYFQFGRYLMISSSRAGSQPATLQGIWNKGTNPPWGSKYTININTEMNYWPADPAGLGMCVEPLLRLVEDISVTGAKTAKTMYAARGWVTHHNTDLWRATAPVDKPPAGLWPMGGAWLCNTLWTHYDYSRDETVLKRLYPLMKGASLFFLDTLIEDPGGRGLITSPSLSPENHHPFGGALCAGPAMDRQMLRDLFDQTIEAGKRLGQDPELLTQIAQTRARLAPDRVGKAGQLQEWLEDWDEEAPEPHHRHVSHLYAVYPSGQINVRDTPDMIRAAKVSLTQRGDLTTGWGTAWRLCLWARMGEGDHAHSILKALTGPQRTYPNMFDAHPPFQIDGNFGGAAGIMELLVQSWGGEVHLLPALPSAWPSGEIKGVRARGGLAIDLRWRAGKLASLTVKGPPGAPVRLRYLDTVKDVVLDTRGAYKQGAPG
ncbi:MAG: glycoside hydrolase N-terminal domain-containing protein, partial [Asticcacaulis sp.]|nr:glycoside hydrolase N-terminal domain-containing protein [Asticcacaulis sp.]